MNARDLEGALGRLRREFDDSFVQSHARDTETLTDLLEIRVSGQPYALRLSQVEALVADRRLVRVPSARSDLLGLANVRGVIAPVYDLAQLLGHAPSVGTRWLVLLRGAPFSVAFERFERHLCALPAAITLAGAESADARGFTAGSVRSDSGPLPLIDLLALPPAVTRGAGRPPTPKREDTP